MVGDVYCGDSGYVVGVHDGDRIVPWEELSQENRAVLREEGLVGLSEWLAMQERIDACTSF